MPKNRHLFIPLFKNASQLLWGGRGRGLGELRYIPASQTVLKLSQSFLHLEDSLYYHHLSLET